MRVERVAEHPRITKPFSEEAWKALDALGEEVDKKLVADDVRLTMGGEPTFVSIDDFESGEWNADAVGPTKRALADRLIRRLRDRFAPGGFLHYGQGKWYPGESLPRWTFSLYWRRDLKPIWRNPERIAAEGEQTGATNEKAEALLGAIASELGVAPDLCRAGLRGSRPSGSSRRPICRRTSRRRIPSSRIPEARHRIARVFSRGLTEPSGYVLPVQRWQAKADGSALAQREMEDPPRRAASRPRRQPGRLPPAAWARCLMFRPPPTPMSSRPIRPSRAGLCPISTTRGSAPSGSPRSPRRKGPAQERVEQRLGDIDGAVRTAVTVEPRDGRLCVFLPPVERLEDYLELVAAAEAAAEKVGLPVQIEGYPPPVDPRLNVIRVAPDPGVIEVNIHPSSSWRECVATTEAIYEEARLSRLGADKFMIDGKHAGTGGGNHVVVGGQTPLDSPFLRRPDLLKSLIIYWLRRPSLSYFFSGLFIGPTSQAPRVDEARHDSLYELEIALSPDPEARATAPRRGRGCSIG